MSTKKRYRKRSKKRMDEPQVQAETVKERVDPETDVVLNISRPPDGQSLKIYIKAPMVANVIAQMAPSNYEKAKYAPIYTPILKALEKDPTRVVTRAAIPRATRNFVGGTDFSFTEPPRAILLSNPEALREGYELTFKVDQPVPYDVLKKWGKQFMEGCQEIITNARPFRMSWVMSKVDQ